jgi:chemotaxis protein methyltransferase CheR
MGISSSDFDYLRGIVREYSAVALTADKSYLADLHLRSIVEAGGFTSISDLVTHLKSQPFGALHAQVVEALVTNETSFFRDIHPFKALQQFVLPDLIAKRTQERTLNIWCAACSNGQEPYSIAMLINDQFPMLTDWRVRLIASDFSSKVLARASQGYYTQLEISRGLSESFWKKYFQQQGNTWQIKDNIRQKVEFHHINLVQPWMPLPPMDIIFLRNVLIYFETETKKAVLNRMRHQLKPDGYLFLGGGETTINLDDSFRRVQLGRSICHQVNP